MTKNTTEKIVLITGGSSGIGKAIGMFLSDRGFTVYGTSRNPERYTSFDAFTLLPMDVTDADTIKAAVQLIKDRHQRIDVLINNAGTGITGPIEEIPEEEVLQNFKTNYFGPLAVSKAVLPLMRAQRKGLIINTTSIGAYMGLPYRGIYSASKAALHITTEAWRMELKSFNIDMVTLAPGDFATNIASGRYHAPVISGSPYEKVYSDSLALMNAHVDEGDDPIEVAKVVYKIIQGSRLKVHYKVGPLLQKFSVFLKKMLPGTRYEKMLMKHYKL